METQRDRLVLLHALERKILWLATWTIHHANHVRPKPDTLKVGGHQASCASLVTLMVALYFDVLRPQDRVAVKPHASPVFHAIQYLFGRQRRENLEAFRALGGAQSYPSRTKDQADIDISTGSVGLGVAMTSFASLVQDYVRLKKLAPERAPGRMIALAGDAEFDEGNLFECLLEGWKHDVRNIWWIIDYNRQSLDSVVEDRLFQPIGALFDNMGWRVVTLKYGKLLEAAFRRPGGDALRAWIDESPNSLYSALVFKGGAAWRERLEQDLGSLPAIRALLDEHDDDALHVLMTNLGGHDLETVLDAFHGITDDRPTCFIAYTIKGHNLPFAGHKDNHSGLMNPEQMEAWQRSQGIPSGSEWEPFRGLDIQEERLRDFVKSVPFASERNRVQDAPRLVIPESLPVPTARVSSTQEGFGRILHDVAREGGEWVDRLVTASPDVTVSTNLGGWVNRRGIFDRRARSDVFREEHVVSAQRWSMSPDGQHIELGIAENNLFLALAALGLAHKMHGARLLPIGVIYDCFIRRGLDALDYACYQDARFLVVATPSGVSLAPEGGAHQSVSTPLIALGQPGLVAYEPAYVDELAEILRFAFDYMQADDGGAVMLRLTTRALEQPKRMLTASLRDSIVAGAYWYEEPAVNAPLAIVAMGTITAEAREAHSRVQEEVPGIGLLVVTSADRLHAGWRAAIRQRTEGDPAATSYVEEILSPLAPSAALVTVIDGHPATLSWLGSVRGQRLIPLGVSEFGQSGSIADLYRRYGLDTDAVLDAVARAFLEICS